MGIGIGIGIRHHLQMPVGEPVGACGQWVLIRPHRAAAPPPGRRALSQGDIWKTCNLPTTKSIVGPTWL